MFLGQHRPAVETAAPADAEMTSSTEETTTMRNSSWLRMLTGRKHTVQHQRARRRLGVRPWLEHLEDRVTPAVQPVSLADPNLWVEGAAGNASDGRTITDDGRYVVFTGGDNIMPGDNNLASDVFLRDLLTGQLTLVSATPAGTFANGSSGTPVITPDGRHVLFFSSATNLVEGIADTNNTSDLFVRDLWNGTTTLVTYNGAETDTSPSGGWNASITPDGRYVVFSAYPNQMAESDGVVGVQVYRRDLVAGVTNRVSIVPNASPNFPPITTGKASISDDGRFVCFQAAPSFSFSIDDIYVRDVVAGTTTLVSVNTGGVGGGNYDSTNAVMSANGRYVAWVSTSSILVANDTNQTYDVFVRDLWLRQTYLASAATTGGVGNSASGVDGSGFTDTPAISADGRYVAFTSWATNLTTVTPSSHLHVYVRDMLAQSTTQASVSDSGAQPNSFSENVIISADGRSVAFLSYASNLAPEGAVGNGQDIFVRNLATGTTRLVTQNVTGVTEFSQQHYNYWLTGNGSHIAFTSPYDNLLTDDGDRTIDVFVRDLGAAQTTLVSRRDPSLPTLTPNGDSFTTVTWHNSRITSNNGQYSVFTSYGTNIAPGDNNGTLDVFRTDALTGEITLVSSNLAGTGTGNNRSLWPSISGDGRYVAFNSNATDLMNISDGNGSGDIFLRDMNTGILTLITINASGTGTANAGGELPLLSETGRYVVFRSRATDLTAVRDTNSWHDYYIRDVLAGTTTLITASTSGTGVGSNNHADRAAMTPDGRFVVYQSRAGDLVAGDGNGVGDVFIYDHNTGSTRMVSVSSAGAIGNGESKNAVVSADGRYVVFESLATNLVTGDTSGSDVFLRDLVLGTTTLLSRNASGQLGNGASRNAAISADGRYVAFESDASNLVAGDGNAKSDVFVYEVATGSLTLVSVNASETGSGAGVSTYPILSADGRRVVFASAANDLAPGDQSPFYENLFLRDLDAGNTTLVDNAGTRYGNVMGQSYGITPDGETVTFTATGGDLLAGDFNNMQDVFIWHNNAPAGHPGGPYSVPEGGSITLDGTQSFDPDGTIVLYEWDLDYDGIFAADVAGATTTFSAATIDGPASRSVALRVTDNLGQSTVVVSSVTVTNVAPIATIENDGPVDEGGRATVQLSGADDPAPADVQAGFRYSFALSQDDLADSYVTASSSASAQFVIDDNGAYTIYGRIFDDDNGFRDYSTVVTVNSVAPSASLTNDGPVDEGSPATVSFTNPSDSSAADIAAGFRYSFALSSAGLAGSHGGAGAASSAQFTFDEDGTYTVYGRIFDKDNDYRDYATVVTVDNVAPEAVFDDNGPVDESSPVAVSFTNPSDPSAADTAAGFRYSFALSAAGLADSYAAADTSAMADFTFDDNGAYTVFGRVFDDDGGFSDYSTEIVVQNVAPTAAVSGPDQGVRGQSRTFAFSAMDASSADQAAGFSFRVDWGDGSAVQTQSGAASFTLVHVFPGSGTFAVRVWATDKDGAESAVASASITIVAAQLQGGDLVVGGTTAGDAIVVKPSDATGNLSVTINGAAFGTFRPTGKILVYAQAGNDTVQFQSAKIQKTTYLVAVSAVVYGDSGSDTINMQGSSANNVLLGGANNDQLQGGAGRDLLIGGLGADTLQGADGEDILIGARTDHDSDLAALLAIFDEWGRTDLGYAERISHLTGATTGGFNGSAFLNAQTIHEDDAVDQLFGGNQLDWFLYQAAGPFADSLSDKRRNETATMI